MRPASVVPRPRSGARSHDIHRTRHLRSSWHSYPALSASMDLLAAGAALRVGPAPAFARTDAFSRHGRPCAGHPDAERRRASLYRDHRDEPGDDVGGCGPLVSHPLKMRAWGAQEIGHPLKMRAWGAQEIGHPLSMRARKAKTGIIGGCHPARGGISAKRSSGDPGFCRAAPEWRLTVHFTFARGCAALNASIRRAASTFV
jgi:hypothetical protein